MRLFSLIQALMLHMSQTNVIKNSVEKIFNKCMRTVFHVSRCALKIIQRFRTYNSSVIFSIYLIKQQYLDNRIHNGDTIFKRGNVKSNA